MADEHSIPATSGTFAVVVVEGPDQGKGTPIEPFKPRMFIGQSEALGDLVAFTSALNLLCHLVLIALFGLFSLIKTRF